MDLFYIRFKGRVTGPFQKEDIQKRAKEGMLSRFHDLSTDGQLWKKAADVPDLWSIPSDVNSLIEPEEVAVPLPDPVITQTTSEPTIPAPVTPGPFAGIPVISAPTQSHTQWHYQQRNGHQCGPLPIAVMQNLIRQGDIVRSTLIWANGFSDWTEVQDVPDFSSLF
jgi:hypothetical protein